jgi:opacity protein-like surface antigen
MRKFLVGALLLAAASAPLSAQQMGQPVTAGHGSFYLGPYAGYMIFGDLFETASNVEYSNENGGLYGVQAGFSLSPNFSILGNIGYTKSKFTAENVPSSNNTTVTQNLGGDIGVWLYDANLQFRLPFMQQNSWIAPLAQVGAGAIRYTQDYNDFNSDAQTDVAFNVGIGGDIQFAQAVGLRIMAKDYITSLNWSNDNSIRSDAFEGQTAHNWAVTVGLNIGF